jgi:flagellar basal body P-ring formation protein FlgA
MRPLLALLPLMLCAQAAMGQTTEFEDLNRLDARIEQLVGGDAGDAKPVPIDRRLKLPKCVEAVELERISIDSVAVRCPAKGWRIRVPIRTTTTPNTTTHMATELVIRRGEVVEVRFEGDGFSATSEGSAMDDGQVGKSIRVKTTASAAPLNATVVGAGIVRIRSQTN